jgi:o-succinylbenzoate synthase
LQSEEDVEGFGEVAPLPGFSQESIAQAGDQLRHLPSQLCSQEIPDNVTEFNGQFDRWLGPFNLGPSVRFGIESAVLHLLANAQECPLYKLIPASKDHSIRIVGLISTSTGNVRTQTRNLVRAGFTELKLKVGGNLEQDIANVMAVNDVARGKALLHVDANQSWSYAQALAFGQQIGCGAVSYIEEPFKEINRVPEFFEETLIPVALDESLQHLTFDAVRRMPGVETIVIKPTILGGIEKTLRLMSQSEHHAIETVISSTYESSLGIWTLANIAEATPRYRAAGLDTLKWLKEDIFTTAIRFRHGAISIGDRMIRSRDINFNLLHELV